MPKSITISRSKDEEALRAALMKLLTKHLATMPICATNAWLIEQVDELCQTAELGDWLGPDNPEIDEDIPF